MSSFFLGMIKRVLAPKAITAAVICAFLGLAPASAEAPTFLTKAELLELIPGSTIYSKTERGINWAQVYSHADGKTKGGIRSIFGKRRLYAKWFVRGNQWCENWGRGEACWHFEKAGHRTLRVYTLDGKVRRNLWVLKRRDISG